MWVLPSTVENKSRRYVGRVPLATPSPADHGVARVRPGRRPEKSAGHATVRGVATPAGPAVAQGVAAPAKPAVAQGVAAPVEPTAVAEPLDDATALLRPPDVTAAIVVDGSGRRGRWLRRTVYVLVAFALLLILVFWIVQGVDAFGSAA